MCKTPQVEIDENSFRRNYEIEIVLIYLSEFSYFFCRRVTVKVSNINKIWRN